jgi:hypothetical protein
MPRMDGCIHSLASWLGQVLVLPQKGVIVGIDIHG